MLSFSRGFILFFTISVFLSTSQSSYIKNAAMISIPPEKPIPYQNKTEIFIILSLVRNAVGFKKGSHKFIPVISLKPYRPTIVLDAGHGGRDPGSISRSGHYEKNITLKMALYLYQALRKTLRYNIILTRKRDVFVPKRKRFSIARKSRADLFISIHADNHPSPHIRGLTIYTLSTKASDAEALRLSKQENKKKYFQGVSLEGISLKEEDGIFDVFIDIAQRGSSNAALLFAKFFHRNLQSYNVGSLMTLRSADLVVLKAPEIPSILVELGYLSNAKDEKLIGTLKYKKMISRALIQSLDTYFKKS